MSGPGPDGFNLATVFGTVARAVPDQEVLVWRDRRVTYAEMDARIDGIAHFFVDRGLGVRTERSELANHESGQDHAGLYLRNGNEYLEAMLGAFRARVGAFNINYRYVEEELVYLLNDADTKALVFHSEFAPVVAADPRPAAPALCARPGPRRVRQRAAARRGLVGGRARHAGARRWHADAQW